DARNIGEAQLGDKVVNATQLAEQDKILYAFRLAGQYKEPIIVQAHDGILRLDPTDVKHFVYGPDGNVLEINGDKVTVAEFSRMVLNEKALADIPPGKLASEYSNRSYIFNLQPVGEHKSGLIGAYFQTEDGKYHSLA